MKKVAIVNYEMGNLDSVARAIEYCGGIPLITNQEKDFNKATHIILPGVGAFIAGMKNLKKYELDRILKKEVVENKIPYVGWNEVNLNQKSFLFNDIPSGKDFYFVHSYHFMPKDKKNIMAETFYGENFVAVIQKDNIFGVQFHPEKSQKLGLLLLNNFLTI